jgi:hypothetical protein
MQVTAPVQRCKFRQTAAILVALAVACGARPAGADAPAAAPDTATPPSAAPPAGADPSKTECLERYEAAQVARRERRLLDSRTALRVCSAAACPSAIRADCVDWLGQVSNSIPSVVVTARARGADVFAVKVFIDGNLATERLTGFALEIDPGPHTFRFESPPWPAIEREILASEGVKDRHIDLEFAPPLPAATALSPRAEPAPFRLQRSDYVFGGIALAGLATLGYFGGTALYDANQYEKSCGSYCDPDQVDQLRTKLLIADIGLSVAVLALVVGLYLHGKGAF